MNNEEVEISATELTTEELDAVHGGMTNSQTPLFQAFVLGMIKGYHEAGGVVTVEYH